MTLLGSYLTRTEREYFNEFRRYFDEIKRRADSGLNESVNAVGFIMKDEEGYRLIPFPSLTDLERYSIRLDIPFQLKRKIKEWSYVEVIGKPCVIKRLLRDFSLQTIYVLEVDEIYEVKPIQIKISPKFFDNFVDTIFYGLKGVDDEEKEILH